MKNKFNKYLFAAFLLICLFLTVSPATADSQWDQKEIYNQVDNSVISMDISGDYVVFQTSSESSMNQSSNRVHLYDTRSGSLKTIGIPSPGMTVTGNGISGNYVTWFETQAVDFDLNESETKPNTIYLMDITQNTTKKLNLPGTAEWPVISGDTILWSESPGESLETNINIYNIATEKTTGIFNISLGNPGGIDYDNGNIAYADSKALHIYNVESGNDTAVFTFEYSNESGSNVMDFDMAGDYIIYFKHQFVFKGDDRGMYDEPYLYTISTGETSLLNPITGNFTDSLTKSEKKASVTSPFTDGETVGWGYLKSESDSDIILLYPVTGNTSVMKVPGSILEIHIDGNSIVWSKSVFPSFHSTLEYAKENETAAEIPTESAPGFSVLIGILGISVCVLLLRRIKE